MLTGAFGQKELARILGLAIVCVLASLSPRTLRLMTMEAPPPHRRRSLRPCGSLVVTGRLRTWWFICSSDLVFPIYIPIVYHMCFTFVPQGGRTTGLGPHYTISGNILVGQKEFDQV